MKKIRIMLSVMAIVFAMGGAVASEFLFTAIPGWEFVDHPGVEDDQCVFRGNLCDDLGTIPCTIGTSSTVLRANSDVSGTPSCGQDLKKMP